MEIQRSRTSDLEDSLEEEQHAAIGAITGMMGHSPEQLLEAVNAFAHHVCDPAAQLLASTLQAPDRAGDAAQAGPSATGGASPAKGVTKPRGARTNAAPAIAGKSKKGRVSKARGPQVSGKAGKTHRVRSGDTLWAIAQKSGVSLNSLIAANPQIANPDLIFPGQKVKIPKGGSSPDAGGGGNAPAAQHDGGGTAPTAQRPSGSDGGEMISGAGVKDVSPEGRRQMATLLKHAKENSGGKRAMGWCLREVQDILQRGAYGKIGNGKMPRFPYARNAAEWLNDGKPPRWKSMGLKRLNIDNPYDAPPGAIVVVRAGTPGTSHPTAGDIAIAAGGGRFLNDGEMGYGGSGKFPKGNNYVLGVYVPA